MTTTDSDNFVPPLSDAPEASTLQHDAPFWHFQYPPRDEQVDSLNLIKDMAPGQVLALQLPTGLGKSPILASTALEFGGAVLTPYKMLQDQYKRDWDTLSDFRGRDNYHCALAPKDAPPTCKYGKHLKCAGCPYNVAKREFFTGKAGLTNYAAFLSMNPISDHEWLCMDECVPGNTKMVVDHHGDVLPVTMSDVMGGVGQKVFGRGDAGPGFFPIISRTSMGRKRLWKVVATSGAQTKTLYITGNGRVWCNGRYVNPTEIGVGDVVSMSGSWCATYRHGSSHVQAATTATNRCGKAWKRAAMRLRLWAADKLAEEQVQQVSAGSQFGVVKGGIDRPSETTHYGDIARRWFSVLRQKKSKRPTTHTALNQETNQILPLEAGRIGRHLQSRGKGERNSGELRQREHVVQYSIPPLHSGPGTQAVHPKENSNAGVLGSAGRFRTGRVVDGRRVELQPVHAQFLARGAGTHSGVVCRKMGSVTENRLGQKKAAVVPVPGRRDVQAPVRNHRTARYPIDAVQVRRLMRLETGVVTSVVETDEFEETYDIGVADAHNFYANGVLIHNCHQLPDMLMNAFSINWTRRHAEILTGGEPFFPETENMGSFRTVSVDSLTAMASSAGTLRASLEIQLADITEHRQKGKEVQELVNRIDLLKQLGSALTTAISLTEDGAPYIFDQNESNRDEWTAKPVKAGDLWRVWGQKIGLDKRRVVLTSATILSQDILQSWVGEGTEYFEFDSPFPAKRRPIYFYDGHPLSFKSMDREFPKVLKIMDQILDKYPALKGVVHCQSFSLGKRIFESSKHRSRLLLHTSGTPLADLIQTHLQTDKPSILVSPAAAEGIDFKDDSGRLNIIFKMPFASMGSSWVKAKMHYDEGWYEWSTVKTLIQQYGRTTRHDKDWSFTFIIDGSFGRIIDNNGHLFPGWFHDAIK